MWPNGSIPVAFVLTDKERDNEEVSEGNSYTNACEVKKAIDAVFGLHDAGDLPNGVEDIGIITPYSSQVRLIKRCLREKRILHAIKNVEVSSVDGFQGREKEVIVFCAVRSNAERKVGFLCDWRRMNVMMTRAKRGLIIIGNRRTLASDRVWGKWIQWASSCGVTVGENSRGEYEAEYLGDTMVGRNAGSVPKLLDYGAMAKPTKKQNAAKDAEGYDSDDRRARSDSGASWAGSSFDGSHGGLTPVGSPKKGAASGSTLKIPPRILDNWDDETPDNWDDSSDEEDGKAAVTSVASKDTE
jgi:hypothetical protein